MAFVMRALLIAIFAAFSCTRANADVPPAAPPADAKEALHRLAFAENDTALAQYGTLRHKGSSPTSTLTEIVDLRTGDNRSTSLTKDGHFDSGFNASGHWRARRRHFVPHRYDVDERHQRLDAGRRWR
jgi:hypothetical protein